MSVVEGKWMEVMGAPGVRWVALERRSEASVRASRRSGSGPSSKAFMASSGMRSEVSFRA